MEQIDYSKLKFKCWLEIHQQLDSHKLFCSCPSILRNDEPDFSIERKLHAISGESGEVDVAVLHETQKDKTVTVRMRDSMKQVRIPATKLLEFLIMNLDYFTIHHLIRMK